MTPLIVGGATRHIRKIKKIDDKPVHEDAIYPWPKELGKTGKTVVELVNALLAHVRTSVKGIEQIECYLGEKLAVKIESIPEKYRKLPDLSIFESSIAALRFCFGEDEFIEMFVELIASNMDSRKAASIHHSFVDLMKSMSSDDVRILKYLQKYNLSCVAMVGIRETKSEMNVEKAEGYDNLPEMTNCEIFENLMILGILEWRECGKFADNQLSEKLTETKSFEISNEKFLSGLEIDQANIMELVYSYYLVTDYGRKFISCVIGEYTCN